MPDMSAGVACPAEAARLPALVQVHGCRALKLLSVDPQNYPDAPREGIRRILEQLTGNKHPRNEKLDTSRISSIRMGTTVSAAAIQLLQCSNVFQALLLCHKCCDT